MIFISLFLASLVIFRGIFLLSLPKKWKLIFSFLATAVAFKFYILRIFGGRMFSPELPAWILLPFAWFFALLMFWGVWLIICDFAWLGKKLYCRWRNKNNFSGKRESFWRSIGLIPAALLVSIGMYEGLKIPETVEYEVVMPELPPTLEGLKIAHLSDLHADPVSGRSKIARIVELTNRWQPDLVVITGDFVDGRTAARGRDLEVLKELHAPLGVFGVPGNHEYYSGYAEWMEFLRTCGIRMLENQHILLKDGQLALGGVTDIAAIRMNMPYPEVKKTFSGVPENSFRILLAHQPKIAPEAAAEKVNIQLSGHTHGGMVWGLDLLVAAFNSGRVSGFYDVGEMKLFISNGTGIWSGFPVRLGRRSEISFLVLKSK